jgi:hypothetical protein
MARYFFDLVKVDRAVAHDYQGRDFSAPEHARQQGELLALDLQLADGDDWAGGQVSVRDAHGTEWFAIPVTGAE